MIPEHKDSIVIHCLATRKEWGMYKDVDDIVKEVRKWHVVDNGWRDIGYSMVIGYDGSVAMGRDLDNDGDVYDETAAAARGWNKRGIHIALVGGHGSNANDNFFDHFTPEQEKALVKEIRKILKMKPGMRVMGHNEVAAKSCPGFDVAPWWKEVNQPDLFDQDLEDAEDDDLEIIDLIEKLLAWLSKDK